MRSSAVLALVVLGLVLVTAQPPNPGPEPTPEPTPTPEPSPMPVMIPPPIFLLPWMLPFMVHPMFMLMGLHMWASFAHTMFGNHDNGMATPLAPEAMGFGALSGIPSQPQQQPQQPQALPAWYQPQPINNVVFSNVVNQPNNVVVPMQDGGQATMTVQSGVYSPLTAVLQPQALPDQQQLLQWNWPQ